ncbi:hypothetical protein ES705_20952 [subsurface metagenome]
MLARIPVPSDNIWPCMLARKYIKNGKEEIKKGLSIGKYNLRGITSRSLTDGGGQERFIAADYFTNAQKLEVDFPETSKFLKKMGEQYKQEAGWMDKDAEQYKDP